MKTWVEPSIWKFTDKKTYYFVQVSRRLKNGIRASRQARTANLTQARCQKQDFLRELDELAINGKKVTFSDFLKDYYPYLQERVGAGTFYRQTKEIEAHFLPTFRDRILYEITRNDVETLINERTKGKSTQTKKHMLSYASAIFKRARELELIASNPVELIARPKIKSRERLVLNEGQTKLLLVHLREHFPLIFKHVFLSVHTLARAGELRALTWREVDFERKLIRIAKTLDPKTGLKETPKNGLTRHVPMNDELVSFLLQLKEETFNVETDFVLPPWREFSQNEQGKPLKLICKSLGIPLIRYHDLRATGITILLSKGVPTSVVMKIAGHLRLSSTEIYVRAAGIGIEGATRQLMLL